VKLHAAETSCGKLLSYLTFLFLWETSGKRGLFERAFCASTRCKWRFGVFQQSSKYWEMTTQLIVCNMITILYLFKISKLDVIKTVFDKIKKIWERERERERESRKLKKQYDYKSYNEFVDNSMALTTIALKLYPIWLPVRAFKRYLTARAANICPVNILQRKFLAFPFCVLYTTDVTARNKSVRFCGDIALNILSPRHVSYGNNIKFSNIIW